MDENLAKWTESFMRNRRVMSVDGQDGEPVSITTGLPQAPAISLALFAPYIADIYGVVADQVEDSQGISFADDTTRIVEGTDVDDVTDNLVRCAVASLRWAGDNAVRLEESKTEAILFSKRRKQNEVPTGDLGGQHAPSPLQLRGCTAAGHLD